MVRERRDAARAADQGAVTEREGGGASKGEIYVLTRGRGASVPGKYTSNLIRKDKIDQSGPFHEIGGPVFKSPPDFERDERSRLGRADQDAEKPPRTMSAALGLTDTESSATHLTRWAHLSGVALVCGLFLWCCARKRLSPAAACRYQKIAPLGTPKRRSPDSVVEVVIDIPTPTPPPPPHAAAGREAPEAGGATTACGSVEQCGSARKASVALLLDFAQEPLQLSGEEQAPPYSPSIEVAAAALAAVAEAGVAAEAAATAGMAAATLLATTEAAATLATLATHACSQPAPVGHPWYGRRGLRYGPPPLSPPSPSSVLPLAPPTVPPPLPPSLRPPLRPSLRREASVHDGRLHLAFTSADTDGSGGLSKRQLYLALAQVVVVVVVVVVVAATLPRTRTGGSLLDPDPDPGPDPSSTPNTNPNPTPRPRWVWPPRPLSSSRCFVSSTATTTAGWAGKSSEPLARRCSSLWKSMRRRGRTGHGPRRRVTHRRPHASTASAHRRARRRGRRPRRGDRRLALAPAAPGVLAAPGVSVAPLHGAARQRSNVCTARRGASRYVS